MVSEDGLCVEADAPTGLERALSGGGLPARFDVAPFLA